MSARLRAYTGRKLKKKKRFPKIVFDFEYKNDEFSWSRVELEEKEEIHPYFPSTELQDAIQLMQILQRPLLIRGEPGSGKTKVAQAVAYEWHGKEYRNFYFEWHVKSNAKARDELFSFDHITRLRDASLGNDTEDTQSYRKLGALGKAILVAKKTGKPTILLIDEIDKAGIDFPNDLLLELDEGRYKIPETGEEIQAGNVKPLIFITSNQEREMPPAFLRRCLFHFIQPLSPALLEKIVLANYPALRKDESYVSEIVQEFLRLKAEIDKNPARYKSLSTSELIDWAGLLAYHFRKKDKKRFDFANERPFRAALLKTETDLNIE